MSYGHTPFRTTLSPGWAGLGHLESDSLGAEPEMSRPTRVDPTPLAPDSPIQRPTGGPQEPPTQLTPIELISPSHLLLRQHRQLRGWLLLAQFPQQEAPGPSPLLLLPPPQHPFHPQVLPIPPPVLSLPLLPLPLTRQILLPNWSCLPDPSPALQRPGWPENADLPKCPSRCDSMPLPSSPPSPDRSQCPPFSWPLPHALFLPFQKCTRPSSPALGMCLSPTLITLPGPSAWLAICILQGWFVQEALPSQHCSNASPVCSHGPEVPISLSPPSPPCTLTPDALSSQKNLLDCATLDYHHESMDWVCPAPCCHPVPRRWWGAPFGLNQKRKEVETGKRPRPISCV